MERKRILTGVVSMNGITATTKWEEISIDSQQLSHFQNVLMKERPDLDPISATGIILAHRVQIKENEGLVFLIEGVDNFGSEDSNLKDERMFVGFLQEAQQYVKVGASHNWQYDKVKSIFLG